MPEFLKLVTPGEAWQRFLAEFRPVPAPERVPTQGALGRTAFADIAAPHPLPPFTRSTVDGYAVRSRDTFGASDALPAFLDLAGEVSMGAPAPAELAKATCWLIHTGGMLPGGADAVVMVEHTRSTDQGEIEVVRAAAPGDNVIQAGEDVQAGDIVIRAGQQLRAAEIGGLMGLGLTTVSVARRPRVALLSSGDEIIEPDQDPDPGQVRDVNSYALAALVSAAGGEPVRYGILPDEIEAFRGAAEQALAENDIVVFTAGSSISVRDLTAEVIGELGAPGVLVHGVSVRPGKPTILAVCEGKPVIGLPGNPVSALVIAGLFVRPTIERTLGRRPRPSGRVAATLASNIPSQAGREDWVPVRLEQTGGAYRAEPVYGKSNLIFTLARADGLIRIPPEANGLASGSVVEVEFLA